MLRPPKVIDPHCKPSAALGKRPRALAIARYRTPAAQGFATRKPSRVQFQPGQFIDLNA